MKQTETPKGTKNEAQLAAILGFYHNDLNNLLSDLSELDLANLIKLESSCKARKYVLKRLFTRYNKLRGARELKELLKNATKTNSHN